MTTRAFHSVREEYVDVPTGRRGSRVVTRLTSSTWRARSVDPNGWEGDDEESDAILRRMHRNAIGKGSA